MDDAMETREDSKANIPLKGEFPFVDVNAIKQEPIFDEQNANLTEGWLTVDVKREHIDTNDIKEEPSEISTCKIEVTCSKKRKIPDRRTHKCLFCDAYVYNFATHLQRKHSSEEQVKEILALDKTDFNRKRMIGRLRKEGNFYAGDVVPVQIKKTQMLEANSCGLMPCTHCKDCHQNLEEGVFCLLNNRGATTTKDLSKTIPKNFFHIKQNISVLRCIPENIIFGPYSGLESLRNNTSFVWILNGGRQAEIENKHLYNWMRFIPFSTEKSECNLNVFQFNRLLYFRAIRSITCGEELLAYLDQRMVKDFSNDTGKYYYPMEEVVQQVYACIPCCLGFKSEECLRKHLENYIHNNKPPTDIIQCPLCKIVSFDRKYLKFHLANNCVNNKSKSQRSYDYNSGELHKCMICDLVYKHKTNLNRHMNTHKNEKQFSCYQCDFKTSRKGYLKSHIIAKHTKEYACGQCDFVAKRRRDLKSHKITVHSTSTETLEDVNEIEAKPNLDAQSTSENAPRTETKRFTCSICNQSLTERATLARHVRAVHAGEKPYQCEYCDYKCASSGSLGKHIKIHTGEKPHKCQICYRTFLEKHKLKRHMIVHLRQGYPCGKCRHRAPTIDALDTHIQQKHKFEK